MITLLNTILISTILLLNSTENISQKIIGILICIGIFVAAILVVKLLRYIAYHLYWWIDAIQEKIKGTRESHKTKPTIGNKNNLGTDKKTTDEPKKTEEPQKTINVKSEPMDTENKYEGLNTTELVKAILKDSNCTYDESEDKMDLIFSYQGETFLARIPEADNPRIRLFDVNWYSCPLDNLEEMSCMQKAINAANIGQMSTAVYIIDKEQKCMTVYSKADFFIWNNIPQPDNYFRMWLNSMFYLKQDIVVEFEKEKQKIGLND